MLKKKINENFPKYLKNESNFFYSNELRKFPILFPHFFLSKERTQKLSPKTKQKFLQI
jgi:hypothetical protein